MPNSLDKAKRNGSLSWWAWGFATVGTIALSFVGSIISLVLALRLNGRGERGQAIAVVLTSVAIATVSLVIYLNNVISDSDTPPSRSPSAAEVEHLLHNAEQAQRANESLRQLRRISE